MEIGKNYIITRQPDDWHAHLREEKLLKAVIDLFNIYGRVVCMGNLAEPVDTLEKIADYQRQILGHDFLPIIGVMLTKNLTKEKFASMLNIFNGMFFLKYMPKGVTTNSEQGIEWQELEKYYPILELAKIRQVPILLHAEMDKDPKTGALIPEIEREAAATHEVAKLAKTFPGAIINVEHVSSRYMIGIIHAYSNLSGSISLNHLIHKYEDVFNAQDELIDVHKYFKPVAKRKADRNMIITTALSGSPKFFFGSDSAPHFIADKVTFKKAGAFNALTNLAAGCEFFEKYDALDERFENFFSGYGAARYNFPLNTGTIKLIRKRWVVPMIYNGLAPDLAGRIMEWQVVE